LRTVEGSERRTARRSKSERRAVIISFRFFGSWPYPGMSVSTLLSTGPAETGPKRGETGDNGRGQNVTVVQGLCGIQSGRPRRLIMAHVGDVLPRSCRCALANVALRVDLLRSTQLRSEVEAQQRRWAHQKHGGEGRRSPLRCGGLVLTASSLGAHEHLRRTWHSLCELLSRIPLSQGSVGPVVLFPEAAGRPHSCRRSPRPTPTLSRRRGVGVAGEVAANRHVSEARYNNKSCCREAPDAALGNDRTTTWGRR
jgi:hypothetical protein